MSRVVTKHYFRRRARAKARELNEAAYWKPGGTGVSAFRVQAAERGPYRWYVVRL